MQAISQSLVQSALLSSPCDVVGHVVVWPMCGSCRNVLVVLYYCVIPYSWNGDVLHCGMGCDRVVILTMECHVCYMVIHFILLHNRWMRADNENDMQCAAMRVRSTVCGCASSLFLSLLSLSLAAAAARRIIIPSIGCAWLC